MTAVTLPPALARLRDPWNASSGRMRRDLLARRVANAADIRIALDALNHALVALPSLNDQPDEALPAGLGEYFDFTADWLAEAMPTLDDFSSASVAALLHERSGDDPDPREVRALSERWLRYTTADIVWSALGWLARELQRLGDPTAIDELMGVVERQLIRQTNDMAAILLTHVTCIARERARPLLLAVAADDRAETELRDHAMSLQTWIDELPADPHV